MHLGCRPLFNRLDVQQTGTRQRAYDRETCDRYEGCGYASASAATSSRRRVAGMSAIRPPMSSPKESASLGCVCVNV